MKKQLTPAPDARGQSRQRYVTGKSLAMAFLLSTTSLVLTNAGQAGGSATAATDSETARGVLQEAPCDIEDAIAAAKAKAAKQAGDLAAAKDPELDDAQNRADRAGKRVGKGDEFSWEGGGSRQKYSMDIPQFTLRYTTKSFDVPETSWKETRTRFGRMESCWWKTDLPFGGEIKTKGTCWRESDIVWSVPQFRMGRVEIQVPDTLETKMKTVEFSWDLPTVTVRDNREELDKANENIKKINRDLEQGTANIADRNTEDAKNQIAAILDRSESDALAAFDKEQAASLKVFEDQRAELNRSLADARGRLSQAGQQGRADAAFAPAFQLIDDAQARFVASAADARAKIGQEIKALREAYLGEGGNALACKAG